MSYNQKYKTIGKVAVLLGLKNSKGKPNTHTIRFWEQEFKVIKPKIINSRRYYSLENIDILKNIKYLLKEKGMTIKGVKNLINKDQSLVDVKEFMNIKKTQDIRIKLDKISRLIKELKNN